MKRPPRQHTREISSLAISIGLHTGLLLALSLAWVSTRPPEAEPLEVQFVRLPPPPASVEGQPDPGPVSQSQAHGSEHDPGEGRAAHTATARPREKTGPTVGMRIRVSAQPDREPNQRTTPPAIVSRWEPAADLPRPRAISRSRPFARAAMGWSGSSSRPDPIPALDPDDLEFHLHDHGSDLLKRLLPALPAPREGTRGGSTGPLLEIIQQRIDRVAPLVHRTTAGCRNASGEARIRFVMDRRGYPIGYQVLDSSGNVCLDGQIDTVLHLAEPYPFVAGWIPVKVRFVL